MADESSFCRTNQANADKYYHDILSFGIPEQGPEFELKPNYYEDWVYMQMYGEAYK